MMLVLIAPLRSYNVQIVTHMAHVDCCAHSHGVYRDCNNSPTYVYLQIVMLAHMMYICSLLQLLIRSILLHLLLCCTIIMLSCVVCLCFVHNLYYLHGYVCSCNVLCYVRSHDANHYVHSRIIDCYIHSYSAHCRVHPQYLDNLLYLHTCAIISWSLSPHWLLYIQNYAFSSSFGVDINHAL